MRIPALLIVLAAVGLSASGCAVNETYDYGDRSPVYYTVAIFASPAIYIFTSDGGFSDGMEGPGAADPRAQADLNANRAAHEAEVDVIRFQSTKVDEALAKTVVKPADRMGTPVGPQPPEEGDEPATPPSEPAPSEPAPKGPAPTDPAPEEPAGEEPAPPETPGKEGSGLKPG